MEANDHFFERPILNDPYLQPARHSSRPFDRPSSGRIAVKVINHLGDEVMKVFRVTP
jgi:hypothetical protein